MDPAHIRACAISQSSTFPRARIHAFGRARKKHAARLRLRLSNPTHTNALERSSIIPTGRAVTVPPQLGLEEAQQEKTLPRTSALPAQTETSSRRTPPALLFKFDGCEHPLGDVYLNVRRSGAHRAVRRLCYRSRICPPTATNLLPVCA